MRLDALTNGAATAACFTCLQGDTPVVWRGPIVNNAIDRFLWAHHVLLLLLLPASPACRVTRRSCGVVPL
jgi:hypothetical protein